MPHYLALLRGINVGKAKRLAMADLRALIESLGGKDVRTLLNSGNVVFSLARASEATLAKKIEARIESSFGISSRVVVISADTLREIVAANPLSDAIPDPSKFLVGFVTEITEKSTLTDLKSLSKETWQPDQIAIGPHACYLACASGILESALLKAVTKITKENMTTRNWATVSKLLEMVESGPQKTAKH